LERGSESRLRGQAEPAVDALGARADVLQALARRGGLSVEAVTVVADRHEAFSVDPFSDHDLGTRRVRVFADVSEPFLHDAKYLDLLVWREPHVWIDVELDLQLPVGSEEVDVATEGRVERRRARGGREREHGKACLLLGGSRRFLEVSA